MTTIEVRIKSISNSDIPNLNIRQPSNASHAQIRLPLNHSFFIFLNITPIPHPTSVPVKINTINTTDMKNQVLHPSKVLFSGSMNPHPNEPNEITRIHKGVKEKKIIDAVTRPFNL